MRKTGMMILAALICLACLTGGAAAETGALNGTIRVFLASVRNQEALHLTFSGRYALEDGTPVEQGAEGVLRREGDMLSLTIGGTGAAKGQRISLRRLPAAGENGIRIAEARIPGNLYPADFVFTADGNGVIRAVAGLWLEDYLGGVLPYEMDESFPAEALKAQAVAARTYAMRKMALQSPDYDLMDTTADQVYCGTPSGAEASQAALEATQGMVGLFREGFMPAYYTASNGGQTETAEHAWGGTAGLPGEDLPMKDDPYDRANPQSAVRTAVFYRNGGTDVPALTELLRRRAGEATGLRMPAVTAIRAVRPEGARYGGDSRLFTRVAVEAEVSGYGAATLTFDYFGELEEAGGLSLNILDNELLDVEEDTFGFRLNARRLGHGVGLSQRGAEEMARQGMTAEEILAFYYPGATLARYETAHPLYGAEGGVFPSVRTVRTENPLDWVWLRAQPGENAEILARIDSGRGVVVFLEDGGYAFVQYGMKTGYVPSASVAREAEPAGEAAADAGGTEAAEVRVRLADEEQTLNLRAAPAKDGQVIGHLRSGERLSLLMTRDGWSCVRYGETIGFVRSEYLEKAAPETEAAHAVPAGIRAVIVEPAGLDMTAEATPASFVYLHLPQGTTLDVTDTGENGMVHVSLGGLSGYVPQEGLFFSMEADGTPEPSPSPAAAPLTGGTETGAPEGAGMEAAVRAAGGLMLRAAPDPSADPLAAMPDGAIVRVLSFDVRNGFAAVSWNGQRGYAAVAYLQPAGTEPDTPAPSAAPESGADEARRGVITADRGVNLRETPSESGRIITVLQKGILVRITGDEENGFLPVRIGQLAGYVSARYVSPAEEAAAEADPAAPAGAETPARVTVTSTNGLHLRTAPRADAPSRYVLPYGTVLQVLDGDGRYWHVAWGGYEGYVSASYVQPLE